MSVRKQFVVTGDARTGQSVAGGDIQLYREWFWNTLYAYGYTPIDMEVQTGWTGWGDMSVYFSLDVVCNDNVLMLRERLANLVRHATLIADPSVSTLGNDPNSAACGNAVSGQPAAVPPNYVYDGGQLATVNVWGGGNPAANGPPNNRPPADDRGDSLSAEEFLKKYGFYVMGGLAVLLLATRK